MKEIELLKNEIEQLRQEIKKLGNSTTIPKDTEDAFRTRFRIDEFTPMTTSSKSSGSENVAVDEGGGATYFVLGNPNGFLQVIVNGTVYYLPYFL